MPRKSDASETPRREKPVGRAARFAAARKNPNDLLKDFERLLLREALEPDDRRQDVIHPSEMSHSDWCPRSTYLRIVRARAGTLPTRDAHHFQLENIFEEGHEYHRKWQDRARRMNRLHGLWKCEACEHRWFAKSPPYCPECGAPDGAISYKEVPLRDKKALIYGNADGEVLGLHEEADDVLIEIKSIGEGTIRVELPAVYMKHMVVTEDKWGRERKVLDYRGVWKEISVPFSPHLKQGLTYLRLRNQMAEELGLAPINRIVYIYEFKATSLTKAFYVTRNDEAVQPLWDLALDIVYALDGGGQPPRCIEGRNGPCKECKVYADAPDAPAREQATPSSRAVFLRSRHE